MAGIKHVHFPLPNFDVVLGVKGSSFAACGSTDGNSDPSRALGKLTDTTSNKVILQNIPPLRNSYPHTPRNFWVILFKLNPMAGHQYLLEISHPDDSSSTKKVPLNSISPGGFGTTITSPTPGSHVCQDFTAYGSSSGTQIAGHIYNDIYSLPGWPLQQPDTNSDWVMQFNSVPITGLTNSVLYTLRVDANDNTFDQKDQLTVDQCP